MIVTGTVVDACVDEHINAQVTIVNPLTGRRVENTYDSVKHMFSHIVTVDDFGSDRDFRAKEVTLDIISQHPRYGSKTTTQVVKLPEDTEYPDSVKIFTDSINIKIPMGNQPQLIPIVAESEYVAKSKRTNPKLADFNGLVMEEILNWSLYPLLTYVFFDEGSSVIPNRYLTFKSAAERRNFTDTTIIGATLNKYYHILNIFGFRLTQHPEETIEIVGCTDNLNAPEKRDGLSRERAEVVFNYLRDI